MIAKKIDRVAGEGSFDALVRYVSDAAKASATLTSGVLDLDTAAAEMRAVADLGRSKDPMVHWVVSWPDGENPTDEQALKAARNLIDRLGFGEHQYVCAVHRDTDHVHVHLSINRVHPKSFHAHHPRGDAFVADRTMREVELEQGWQHDRGRYVVSDIGGEKVIHEADRPAKETLKSDRAKRFEQETGEASFQDWVAQGEVAAAINAAHSWEEVHTALAALGIELFEVRHGGRRGLILQAHDSPAHRAKASQIGVGYALTDLEERFGLFDANDRQRFEVPAKVLEALTEHEAHFSESDLRSYIESEFEESEREVIFGNVLAYSETLELETDDGKECRFTSRQARTEEETVLDTAERLVKEIGPAVSGASRLDAIETRTMRTDQLAAFGTATGAERLAIIQGRAGSGKSYAAGAVREAYERSGTTVFGLAPTNAVVSDMRGDGFDAHTVHSFLLQVRRGYLKLPPNSVLVLDEAGMLDNATMSALLQVIERAGAKIIMIGDEKQLPAVGRGGLFSELLTRHASATISKVTRQKVGWQRRASELLGEYRFEEAVELFEDNGAIAMSEDPDAQLEALLAEYDAADARDPERQRLVLAYSNKDVVRINDRIREGRRARGALGGEEVSVRTYLTRPKKGEKPKLVEQRFSIGDRLQVTETDKKIGLVNGSFGDVVQVYEDGVTVRFDGARETTRVRFGTGPGETIGVRLGYASTVYKSQGRTIDEVWLHHTIHWRDAASYVALSRQRWAVRIFANHKTCRGGLAALMARYGRKSASVSVGSEVAARKADSTPAPPLRRERRHSRNPERRRQQRTKRQGQREKLRRRFETEAKADLERRRTQWRERREELKVGLKSELGTLKDINQERRRECFALDLSIGVRRALDQVRAREYREERSAIRAKYAKAREKLGPVPKRLSYGEYLRKQTTRDADGGEGDTLPTFSFKPERSAFDLHDVSDARAAWAKNRRIDVETAARRFGLSPELLTEISHELRQTERGDLICAHFGADRRSRTGYETVTAEGSSLLKDSAASISVFRPKSTDDVRRIVICRSAAEVLKQMKKDGSTQWRQSIYVSTGGSTGARTAKHLETVVGLYPSATLLTDILSVRIQENVPWRTKELIDHLKKLAWNSAANRP